MEQKQISNLSYFSFDVIQPGCRWRRNREWWWLPRATAPTWSVCPDPDTLLLPGTNKLERTALNLTRYTHTHTHTHTRTHTLNYLIISASGITFFKCSDNNCKDRAENLASVYFYFRASMSSTRPSSMIHDISQTVKYTTSTEHYIWSLSFFLSPGGNRWPARGDWAGHSDSSSWAVSWRRLPLPGGGAWLPLDSRHCPPRCREPLSQSSACFLVCLVLSEHRIQALVQGRDGADSPWKPRSTLSCPRIPPPTQPSSSWWYHEGA